MDPVNINALDIRSFAAGASVPFGALCYRTEDGVVKPTLTGTKYDYVGVAVEDQVRRETSPGFYAEKDLMPLITAGLAKVWLLGGDVVTAGGFVKIPGTLGAGTENLGVVGKETTVTTRTAASVGRAVEDAGDSDFDQDVSSISGKTLTIANLSSLDLKIGDRVVIDSDEAAEFNVIDDPAATSTSCNLMNTPNASHSTNIKIYKLVQLGVVLI